MESVLFKLWLFVGIFFIIGEFLLPGLVVVFIGLAALTVALGIHLGFLDSFLLQLVTFFISSILYLLTLRVLILSFVPADEEKANIDEDVAAMGMEVEVVVAIPPSGTGRISYSESTWQAKSNSIVEIPNSTKVKIIGRENITWVVEKI